MTTVFKLNGETLVRFRLNGCQHILIEPTHKLFDDILIANLANQTIYYIVKDFLEKNHYQNLTDMPLSTARWYRRRGGRWSLTIPID